MVATVNRLGLDEAGACVRHVIAAMGGRIVTKDDAPEMKAIARGFDLIRAVAPGATLPTGDEFLQRFATTLGWNVYLPSGLWTDALALLEVGIHEAQHVHQWWKGGDYVGLGPGVLNMAALYLAQPEARVRYECEAMRTTFEVSRALMLPMPAPAQLARSLRCAYMIPADLADHAQRLLEGAEVEARHGVLVTAAGKAACAWLTERGIQGLEEP